MSSNHKQEVAFRCEGPCLGLALGAILKLETFIFCIIEKWKKKMITESLAG